MKSEDPCVERTRDPNVVVRDQQGGAGSKTSLTIQNPERGMVAIVQVDGCLAQLNECACDFILLFWEALKLFLEFKGKDLEKAARQIEATMSSQGRTFRASRSEALIICTAVPKPVRAQKLVKEFGKRHGFQLRIKSRHCTCQVSETGVLTIK